MAETPEAGRDLAVSGPVCDVVGRPGFPLGSTPCGGRGVSLGVPMDFRELDGATRKYMMEAFEEDMAAGKLGSKNMNYRGLSLFPSMLRAAIQGGNEETLERDLQDPSLWKERSSAGRRVPVNASRTLAVTEFGIMYTRGLCLRLKAEGETKCRIYRAGRGVRMCYECTAWEGNLVDIDELLANHRGYGGPGPRVPFGPNCHHSVCRVSG